MQSNVRWILRRNESQPWLRVLDSSLVNYGFEEGAEVPWTVDAANGDNLPLWTLEGSLNAMFLEVPKGGWVTAFTDFLSAGRICFHLDPKRALQIKQVGYVAPVRRADQSKDSYVGPAGVRKEEKK